MAAPSLRDAARRFVRDHERGLVVAWLAGMALVLGVGFGWGIWARGAERAVDAFEGRWTARIDACEALRASGRLEEAALRLEQLDADFPARTSVHRLDRERERLLASLVATYTALGRKRRALETCARLVAFDPRNWKNHWAEAEAALHFKEPELARAALDRLLAIHPTHLPGVEARIALAFDAGRFADVPPLWRAYAAAWRVAAFDVTLGSTQLQVEVPVDGELHRFAVPCALAQGAVGELRLDTHGWSASVGKLAFTPPQRAGVAAAREPLALNDAPWSATDGVSSAPGSISASNARSSLRRAFALPAGDASELELELAACKACTPSLWSMVETSYRNLLLDAEFERESRAVRVGGCLEAGTLYAE